MRLNDLDLQCPISSSLSQSKYLRKIFLTLDPNAGKNYKLTNFHIYKVHRNDLYSEAPCVSEQLNHFNDADAS